MRATRVTITKRTTFVVTAKELREALRLPHNAELTIRVPGGGDWSNTFLDLEEHPLQIKTETTEEEWSEE